MNNNKSHSELSNDTLAMSLDDEEKVVHLLEQNIVVGRAAAQKMPCLALPGRTVFFKVCLGI